MNSLYIIVIVGLLSSIVVSIMKSRAEKADHDPANIEKDRAAEEKYSALCETDESISVICRGYKEEYYVLTNKRLIIDNKKGFNSIPLSSISKVDLKKANGDKARNNSDCQLITIHADKKYTIVRYSGKFDGIAEYFMARFS